MQENMKRQDFVFKYGSYLEIRTHREGVNDIFLSGEYADMPFYIGEVPGDEARTQTEFNLSEIDIAMVTCQNLNVRYMRNKISYLEDRLNNVNKTIRMFSGQVRKECDLIQNNINELRLLIDQPENLSYIEYLPDDLVLFKLDDSVSQAIVLDYDLNEVYTTELKIDFISNEKSAIPKYYCKDNLEKIPYAVHKPIFKPHEIVFNYGLMIKSRNEDASFHHQFACYENLMPDIEKGKLPINMSGFDFYWNEEICKSDMKKKVDALQAFINS